MESFLHKNKEIEFWSITGEVLGQNKYSETHVSSSGGGGYVGKHGGHVSAPHIESTIVTNHEFWVKKEDGSEKSVKLAGCDFPLRVGQKITLISAGIKGKDSGYYSVLVNHNANEHWFIHKADALNKYLKIDQISGKSILIAGGLWWAVTQFTNSIQDGAVVAGLYIAFRLITKLPRIMNMTKSLNKHLESLAQKAYSNT